LFFDSKTHYAGTNYRSNVGKGGLLIFAFFDFNNNGHYDPGEPKVPDLNFHISGGRMESSKRDSSIRVFDLEPFTDYFIEIDKNSFTNVAWQISKPNIRITVDPNKFKLVEVPVSVFGEADGMVYYSDPTGQKGQERIIVNIFNQKGTLAATTMTESDGYFSYLGLKPGSYYARIDDAQLVKVKMTSMPSNIYFKIMGSRDGDIADGLEFVLRSLMNDSINEFAAPIQQLVIPVEKKEIEDKPAPEQKVVIPEIPIPSNNIDAKPKEEGRKVSVPETQVMKPIEGIAIQVGAFKNQSTAEAFRIKIANATKKNVLVEFNAGFYGVRIRGLKDRREAESVLKTLADIGYPSSYILKGK
jgi:hypothetical protein